MAILADGEVVRRNRSPKNHLTQRVPALESAAASNRALSRSTSANGTDSKPPSSLSRRPPAASATSLSHWGISVRVGVSQNLSLFPQIAVAIHFPSGLNSALVIRPPFFSQSVSGWPVPASHTLAAPSCEAVT